YTALLTAVIWLLGLVPGIPLPIMPVPIVLQNIGIFLAGIILGKKYGTLSVIVFLLLAAAGLPVLSGGRGGIGVFAGPSAGFIFLYPVVAFGIGLVRDRYFNKINFAILLVATLVIGVLFLDIVGMIIMGFIIIIHASKEFLLSFTFITGVIINVIIIRLISVKLLNHSR
ncbi:biotin transporter BioY, partial [Staphylococcus haemolyticus]|uniref:biotin transporter BioY n=1 Tax=Staphylococcus haemolyticus TaxID=1283 RepID=UPI0015D6EB0C